MLWTGQEEPIGLVELDRREHSTVEDMFTLMPKFDASDMNSRDPKLFYVNNQLKFRACEFDFGTGKPLRAQQAMLPDMIKFWQEKPDGPVQIIFSGFAAKTRQKL